MKLRNKRTGEIIDNGYVRETHDFQFDGQKHVLAVFKGNGHRPPERVSGAYNSLAELNEEWEDVPEEPKEYWHINEFVTPTKADFVGRETLYDKCRKNFGNYFETKEEAEKAVYEYHLASKTPRFDPDYKGRRKVKRNKQAIKKEPETTEVKETKPVVTSASYITMARGDVTIEIPMSKEDVEKVVSELWSGA